AMLGYAGGTTLAAVLGHLGSAFAAYALLEAAVAGARMFDGRLRSERIMLTVLQVLAVVLVMTQVWRIGATGTVAYWLGVSATLFAVTVLAVFATRHLIGRFWSFVAGASATMAVVVLPFTLDLSGNAVEWYFAAIPLAGAVALLTFGALAPAPRSVSRPVLRGGVFVVAAA